jgi:hypothetical protein
MKLDWPTVVWTPVSQFAPWLAIVLIVTWAGTPGVVCATPVAWLIATRVGLVCVGRSRSSEKGARLAEAALAGALLGVLQGLLFWAVIPRMGPILPSEQAGANGLVLAMLLIGMVAGAALALFTGYLADRRRLV